MKNVIKKAAKDRANHLLPVRVTEQEYRLIKKATKLAGDRYLTRYMRRVVMESLQRKENE